MRKAQWEKRADLLRRAERVAKATSTTEFICPNCESIASVIIEGGEIRAECHGFCQVKAFKAIR